MRPIKKFFENKTVMVTGATGSFGSHFLKTLGEIKVNPKKIIIFSRDELKQYQLRKKIYKYFRSKLRFFLGDVRDRERVFQALNGVDIVIHAAALKQVDTAEYNPSEYIKTNVVGAENITNGSIINNIDYVLALSTDKACSPINLYGASKLLSDKLFISGNDIKGKSRTKLSVLRYGNVMSSRGSVVPYFKELVSHGKPLTITDKNMTRFSITLDEAVKFSFDSLQMMIGGELFVPKIPSYRILDVVKAFEYKKKYKVIGIRSGEKLNEDLISMHDAQRTIDLKNFFVIVPDNLTTPWDQKKFKKKNNLKKVNFCNKDFEYSSNKNKKFLTINEIKKIINKNIYD
mgnify:CR=1 FL=1|tara:strand:- start:12075 stop:13109 length:1035 start_codon:yes stop_codon:yes gene_type:complete